MTEQAQTPEIPEAPKPRRRLSQQTKRMLGVLRQIRNGSHILHACKIAGMNSSTFYRWRKKHPRMADLCEALIAVRVNVVEDALYQACVEDRNISAIIFFLTNRAGEKWADRRALVNNTNIFNAKGEAAKDGKSESVESIFKRMDGYRKDLIPPSDGE